MRKLFDEELKELELTLIKLFNCAQEAVNNLEAVLRGKGSAPTARAKELYGEAQKLSSSLESLCVRLLIHQQPVAGDLREIKSAMTVVYDLVRIAEMCYHTAELENVPGAIATVTEMLRKTQAMVRDAAEGYLRRDAALARCVVDADDAVDSDFLQTRKELVCVLKTNEGRDDWVLDCLLLSKYLERIADHAVNISRETFFLC